MAGPVARPAHKARWSPRCGSAEPDGAGFMSLYKRSLICRRTKVKAGAPYGMF